MEKKLFVFFWTLAVLVSSCAGGANTPPDDDDNDRRPTSSITTDDDGKQAAIDALCAFNGLCSDETSSSAVTSSTSVDEETSAEDETSSSAAITSSTSVDEESSSTSAEEDETTTTTTPPTSTTGGVGVVTQGVEGVKLETCKKSTEYKFESQQPLDTEASYGYCMLVSGIEQCPADALVDISYPDPEVEDEEELIAARLWYCSFWFFVYECSAKDETTTNPCVCLRVAYELTERIFAEDPDEVLISDVVEPYYDRYNPLQVGEYSLYEEVYATCQR